MTHPILRPGPYAVWRDEARLLHRRLYQRFPVQAVIANLYNACAEGLPPLNVNQSPDVVWLQALEGLALANLLARLIDVVKAEGSGENLAEAIGQVEAAEPWLATRVVSSEVLVLDRQPLREALDRLGPDTAPAKVVLVRGQPKSGKTYGRHLFDLAAQDHGADSLYLSAGMVATVEDAVLWLFSNLDAVDDDIPSVDSTNNAWHLTVILKMLQLVSKRGRPVWIAVDDLGPGPDGTPLMDEKIRMFFERLAVHLLNPGARRWLRLMLIHYPDGTPTGWQRELWCEDRVDDAGIGPDDIIALIRDWAKGRERAQLTDDHLRDIAANLVAAASTAATGPDPQPRLLALHDSLVAKLSDLEAAS